MSQTGRGVSTRSQVHHSFATYPDPLRGDMGDKANACAGLFVMAATASVVDEARREQAMIEKMGDAIVGRPCEEPGCENLIEEKRLRARPFTKLCISCADKQDPMNTRRTRS